MILQARLVLFRSGTQSLQFSSGLPDCTALHGTKIVRTRPTALVLQFKESAKFY